MTSEKRYYLKRQAEKMNARFIRCGGVTYEVTHTSYFNGPSCFSVDEVVPIDVPAFVPDPTYYEDETSKGGV